MPAQSRGGHHVPPGLQSKSTPNLPILGSLDVSAPPRAGVDPAPLTAAPLDTSGRLPLEQPSHSPTITSPSEPASIEDNNDDANDMFTLDASDTSDGEEEEEEEELISQPSADRPHLPMSRSYTHLPQPAHPSTLYPPFYNRPPTPLPPSPSLTSLLRPSFSTHPSSRPTTPDSSDVEYNSTATTTTTGANANLALSKSARLAPTSVPRASPKVPTYEYYGFALYLASSAAFLTYILWAYLPSPFLHQLGIHYYPNRWWALAVPAWLVVLVVYIYVALASYNTQYLTLPMRSCENLVDEAGMVACIDTKTKKIIRPRKTGHEPNGDARDVGNKKVSTRFAAGEEVDWKSLWSIGTDAVMDVPIGGVCEILYGAASDAELEDFELESHGQGSDG